MSLSPTKYQQEILSESSSKDSMMIKALAGCAKTTTMEMLAQKIKGFALATAFNAKIAKELKERFPENFDVKTLNGLGHSALIKGLRRSLTVDQNKLFKLLNKHVKQFSLSKSEWQDVKGLVTSAMTQGLVLGCFPYKGLLQDSEENWQEICHSLLLSPQENLIQCARAVLKESTELAFQGTISFDDQIYISTLCCGFFPKFPIILVDEAQDLSPLNHLQVKKSLAPGGRVIVVGDKHQSIYAFRGADSESMENLRGLKDTWLDKDLPLTFRCPKEIVQRQRAHVPLFEAWHTNKEGRIVDYTTRRWAWHHIEALAENGTIAVISRNNSSILAMAFALLRQRRSIQVLGRDISKTLISLSQKLFPEDNTSTDICLGRLAEWQKQEIDLAELNSKPEKIESIRDRATCLSVLLEQCYSAGTLRDILENIFDQESGQITLSTIHRVKGMEFDCVVHIDPWRLPSKYALQAVAKGDTKWLQQENNLLYVCETRTKDVLVNANYKDFTQ